MADATVAKLNERFAAGNQTLEPDSVVQLQSIMEMHGLSMQDLFFKWEAYCIKMDVQLDGTGSNTAMTMERLRAFKQDLQDALVRRNQGQQTKGTGSAVLGDGMIAHKKIKAERKMQATPRNAAKADVFGLLDGLVPSTPATLGKAVQTKTPSMTRLRGDHAGSSPNYKTPSKEDHMSVGVV